MPIISIKVPFYNWSSYYAMAVIELGQAVAREMKNRPLFGRANEPAESQKTAADQVDCRQTHRETKALPGQPGDRTLLAHGPGCIGGNRSYVRQDHAIHLVA